MSSLVDQKSIFACTLDVVIRATHNEIKRNSKYTACTVTTLSAGISQQSRKPGRKVNGDDKLIRSHASVSCSAVQCHCWYLHEHGTA